MVKKKKGVKKEIVKKGKSYENKFLLGLGILIGIFLLYGFALNLSNITGYASAPSSANLTSPTAALKNLGSGVVDLLRPLAETLLGKVGTDDMLFAKVLFLIIIFGVFYVSLNSLGFFNEHKGILFLIIASASILSVRWLGDISWIQTIILPYTAVGITITAGLPFVLYFLVINKGLAKQPSIIRRTAWIFFGVVFAGFWFSRADKIIGDAIYIYPAVAVCAFIMALADGTIHKYFLKIEGGKVQLEVNKKLIRDLRLELEEVAKDFKNTGNLENYRRDSKKIQERISELSNI